MFSVSLNRRYFEKNGQPIFYLADTCWSAFTNITEEDWTYYLDIRKSQGFNVIQVNLLAQWDASQSHLDIKPFAVKENGHFDFRQWNSAYFDRVECMIQMAYEKEITIALVLLWSNYVPNTWASQMQVRQLGIFPKEQIKSYVDRIMEQYDKFHPIYVISGDTDFQTDEVIAYYDCALRQVKQRNPKAVTTLHIRGREADLPSQLKDNQYLDFYMYQSGHNKAFQAMGYQLAEKFYQFQPVRPVINAEPCYEMMGYSRRVYGRFSREDVRRVAWQSVLSGAHSGITYGAHGIWSWHDSQLPFNSDIGEAFETPYDWHDALHFKGAWDYGFIRQTLEHCDFATLRPVQHFLKNETQDIRMAETRTHYLVYVPSNIQLKLRGDFSQLPMIYLDLETKQSMFVQAVYDEILLETQVPMHRFIKDAVLFIEKT